MNPLVIAAGAAVLLAGVGVALWRRAVASEVAARSRELQRWERRARAIVAGSRDGVLLVRLPGEALLDVNPAAERLAARKREALLRCSTSDLLVPPDLLLRTPARPFLGEGEPVLLGEAALRRGDGDLLPVEVTVMVLEEGPPRVLHVTLRDLSELKRVEARLAEENVLQGILEEILLQARSTGKETVPWPDLLEPLRRLPPSPAAALLLLGEGADPWAGAVLAGAQAVGIQWPLGAPAERSLLCIALRGEKPLLLESAEGLRAFPEGAELAERGFQSLLLIPLLVEGSPIGLLLLPHPSQGAFGPRAADQFRRAATVLALGIRNIQLHRESERKAQRLKQILVTSNSFRLQVFLDDLLKEIVWAVRFSAGFDSVTLGMLEGGEVVRVKALASEDKELIRTRTGTCFPWQAFAGLMREENRMGRSYFIPREEWLQQEFLGSGGGGGPQRDGSRPDDPAALFVPIETRLGRIVGFFLVDAPHDGQRPSLESIQTLEIFANQVAVVIENQRLFEETKQKTEELGALNAQLQLSTANLEVTAKKLERSNRELERANAEMRELDRLKGEFLQNVTHELRTPLAPIMVNSDLLLQKRIGPLAALQEEIIQAICQSAKRLNLLIEDLLDLGRLEAGKMEFRFGDVDPASLVHNSLVEILPIAREKQIAVQRLFEPEGLLIRGDHDRLIQALTNLLRNAVKFTPPGGTVTVAARPAGDGFAGVELAVSDTGIGIPSARIPHIFERFYQVDGSATRKYKGAGLGLAIVKKIVEAHGGTISVESEEGRGSTFRMVLPSAAPPAGPV